MRGADVGRVLVPGEWQDDGACKDKSVRGVQFFPPDVAGSEDAIWATPRAVCNACPVRNACLNYALEVGEKHGMWGGLTPAERKRERAARRSR